MEKPGAAQNSPLLHTTQQYDGTAIGDPIYPQTQPYVILLPIYPRRRRCFRRCSASILSSSSILAAAFFITIFIAGGLFAWPADPDLQVVRLDIDKLRVIPPPRAKFDVKLGITLMVRNPDFYALDYRSVNVSISYRGRPLGSVALADEGHIRARGVSYVDAELRLDGIEVINDAWYLIEDLARGELPLDTVTVIDGKLRLFFIQFPVKGKVSCAIIVNPQTQKVIRQDCYPN